MNDQLTRAMCTLKKVTSRTEHYHARVKLSKANPTKTNPTKPNVT